MRWLLDSVEIVPCSIKCQSWVESTWGTSGFADFFGAKLHTACTFSKEEVLCQSCYMGVSQFCHVTVVSQLCQLWLCQTSHDNGISSLEHWYVILYDIMWHTVTQMSHSIAQKCHTYDDPVTLEILVDIDTCRFSWFSIRLLVFGSIHNPVLDSWSPGKKTRPWVRKRLFLRDLMGLADRYSNPS